MLCLKRLPQIHMIQANINTKTKEHAAYHIHTVRKGQIRVLHLFRQENVLKTQQKL